MILKLKKSDQGWIVLDKIDRITYEFITKETRQRKDYFPDIYIQEIKNNRINENNQAYVELHINSYNNLEKPLIVCTNLPTYILNDEGKTIEKIR